MSRNILYKDHTVEIGDCYLTIFKYYFPLATSKTIMFADIERVSLEDGTGAAQSWGLCTRYMNNWFPLDKKRKEKLTPKFIGVHVKGKKIIPSFTPEDPEKVINLIYENFTEEGKRVVEYRMSQCGKQTEMAQQEMMERIQEQEAENTTTSVNTQKVVEKTESPSKRKIIKAEPIESIE